MSTVLKFKSNPSFCNECGAILPLLKESGDIECFTCQKVQPVDENIIGSEKICYTIHFNSIEARKKELDDEEKRQQAKGDEEEGPVVERKCPKCGNDKMSYATLQLRSADEGQTVFFTCTKCKHKETENS